MKLASSCGAIFAACAIFVAPISAAKEVIWKVPTSVPEGSFFYNNFLQRFSEHLKVYTEGELKLRTFGAGVVVPAFQVYEAVQDGIVEAGHSTPSYLVNQDPANAIFAGFPGGMSPEATITWLYEGSGLESLQQYRQETMGLHTMVVGLGTSEILAHANKPINSIADFENLKYRTSGAWAGVLKNYLKGVPTVVPPGEIYTLLQRKGVDAVEWATPGSNIMEGFHEVAPYIITPGIHQPTFVWEFFVKQETWDALSPELQGRIEDAARLTTLESYLHFAHEDMQAMDKYKEYGTQVITLDQEVIAQVREYGHQWMQEQAREQAEQGNKKMQGLLKDYQDYQNRWARNSSVLVRD
ncbi:TRAP transporter substrate-binding protein DctP [Oceanimonas sp. GK1]|uniref:TRAP transporter substrate-binding protein DctP n=1 Tax=Oceanimonas sp. (strain GK1 / IBRC-M 10197) TaxID=511062 RepID=UPI0002EFF92A|nr:TRAP transporter substrate-binding protein DctP [Oceanimonas sp. GK1]